MMKTRSLTFVFFLCLTELGCQALVGIDELRLQSSENAGGAGGAAGAGGFGGGAGIGGIGGIGGAPIMGSIRCGAADCSVGADSACCYDEYNSPAGATSECVTGPPATDNCDTSAGVNGFESRVECQLPAHCPTGRKCCGTPSTAAGYTWYPEVKCQLSCDWPSRVVCDPDALPSACPVVTINGMMVQLSCQPAQYLPNGTFICAPP